jgi:hypothetical protein
LLWKLFSLKYIPFFINFIWIFAIYLFFFDTVKHCYSECHFLFVSDIFNFTACWQTTKSRIFFTENIKGKVSWNGVLQVTLSLDNNTFSIIQKFRKFRWKKIIKILKISKNPRKSEKSSRITKKPKNPQNSSKTPILPVLPEWPNTATFSHNTKKYTKIPLIFLKTFKNSKKNLKILKTPQKLRYFQCCWSGQIQQFLKNPLKLSQRF